MYDHNFKGLRHCLGYLDGNIVLIMAHKKIKPKDLDKKPKIHVNLMLIVVLGKLGTSRPLSL